MPWRFGNVRRSLRTRILMLVLGLLLASPLAAQDYTITAEAESGFPGDTVDVSVTIDNVQPIRGLTLGLTHQAGITLDSIFQGAVVQATNGGAGADFVQVDVSPVGGPGGIFGTIISLGAPIQEIPTGMNQEIAVFRYVIDGATAPATTIPLDFSDVLGSPPVVTVFSIAGVSFFPIPTSGAVSVDTPPVLGLNCVLADPCICDFDVSWTNPLTYDQITVTLDGLTVATLPGNATSTTVSLAQGNMGQVCVIGTVAGQDSTPECCSIDCPVLPPVLEPQSLECTVDPATCVVSVSWTNAEAYQSLEVRLDGGLIQTLGGTVDMTSVTLPDVNTMYEICVTAVDGCGIALTPVCCMVECPALEFVRSDANSDGVIDISDPVRGLGFLFNMETVVCVKALDANDDGNVDLADIVFSLAQQFTNGANPPAPFPGCGVDGTLDPLPCNSFPACP